METGAKGYFDTIDRLGGMVEAIEQGYPQKEVAEASYRFQQAVEKRAKVIVGVNDFVQEDEPPVPILYIDESTADTQMARLVELRRTRDNDAVRRSLDRLRRRHGALATRCTPCSTACAPMRRSARCATLFARSGASTKRSR